ncbi:MAG: hypothetical protein M3Y33_04190 [Actinomycetota bacterium]|nr:hypothetical protein [Actinomycetota bacterium]
MSGLGNWSVAGGIIVDSGPAAGQRPGPGITAVWTPATGHLQIIGRDLDIIDTCTPPGARYSLLAWTSRGLLGISSTATPASLNVRSRRRYGFTAGGLYTSGTGPDHTTWWSRLPPGRRPPAG